MLEDCSYARHPQTCGYPRVLGDILSCRDDGWHVHASVNAHVLCVCDSELRREPIILSAIFLRHHSHAAVIELVLVLDTPIDIPIPVTRRIATAGAATTLRARARRISTSVLSMRNPQIGIVRLALDALNGLDSVRNVGEVNEGTVPLKGVRKRRRFVMD